MFLCLGSCLPAAGRVLTPDALGDSLAAHGFYQAAIKEYKRALFDRSPDSLRLCLKTGEAYEGLRQTAKARLWYEKVMDRPLDTTCCIEAGFRLAGLALQEHKPVLARYELGELAAFGPERQQREYTELLKAASFLYEFKCDSALYYLGNISPASAWHDPATRIADRTRQYLAVPLKKPVTAMLLSSLLPGAGQFYIGKPATGFKALVLNGALAGLTAGRAYAAYRAYQKGNRAEYRVAVMDVTVVFTGLFLRYYHAGRNRAYNLARQQNQERQERFLGDITAIIKRGP